MILFYLAYLLHDLQALVFVYNILRSSFTLKSWQVYFSMKFHTFTDIKYLIITLHMMIHFSYIHSAFFCSHVQKLKIDKKIFISLHLLRKVIVYTYIMARKNTTYVQQVCGVGVWFTTNNEWKWCFCSRDIGHEHVNVKTFLKRFTLWHMVIFRKIIKILDYTYLIFCGTYYSTNTLNKVRV